MNLILLTCGVFTLGGEMASGGGSKDNPIVLVSPLKLPMGIKRCITLQCLLTSTRVAYILRPVSTATLPVQINKYR